MSSTTRLLVLGVVRTFQPVHGYEVRRELITWRAKEWASVQPGSIYNALKTLTREGFLEVVGTDQVGGRPERTSYRLTSAGDEEFRNLLREEWWTVRQPTDPLMAAISFIGFVSRSEAIAALEHRTAQIQSMVRAIEFGIEAHDGVDSPLHVREMMRLMNARVLAEVQWATQFIARLQRGEYSTGDDPLWLPASELAKAATAKAAAAKAAAATKPTTTKPAATKLAATTRPAAVTKPAATTKPAVMTKPAATKRPAATRRNGGAHGTPAIAEPPSAKRDRNGPGEPGERGRSVERRSRVRGSRAGGARGTTAR